MLLLGPGMSLKPFSRFCKARLFPTRRRGGKGLPGLFLVASPDTVARQCLAAARNRRDVCYVPQFWLPIMAFIRAIPEGIFKKLAI